jgi:hypothetical protein
MIWRSRRLRFDIGLVFVTLPLLPAGPAPPSLLNF